MVRVTNIENKISFLRSTLKKLDRYQRLSMQELTANQDIQGAAERYLYLAAQSAIDAAEMYCKLKNLGKPENMAASIELLRSAAVIDNLLAENLVKMVGFRNILSHGYEIVDYRIVEDILKNHLLDLEQLAQALERNIE